VRKQFVSSMTAKSRQLPNESEDIEMEWLLFRSAIIASAVECCGKKQLRVAGDSEKSTPWWNQNVKEAIRAKKMHSRPCCKTGRHLICNPGTLRCEKLQFWQ